MRSTDRSKICASISYRVFLGGDFESRPPWPPPLVLPLTSQHEEPPHVIYPKACIDGPLSIRSSPRVLSVLARILLAMRVSALVAAALATAAAAWQAPVGRLNPNPNLNPVASAEDNRPALPLSTSGRWILDAHSDRMKLRCVSWSGHLETQMPEGLNKRAVDSVAAFVAEQGFNCVRLTYSIDHALSPDTRVEQAFTNAASAAGVDLKSMQTAYSDALQHNPWVANATTRDVFERVIAALWDNGVMTLMDNHVSRAQWCCSFDDGNGWWDKGFGYTDRNSRHFKTQEWLDGLEATARWTTTQPGVMAMSLRNEPRQLLLQGALPLLGAGDWKRFMSRAAARVHAANPDLLVVVSGPFAATTLLPVRAGPAGAVDFDAWRGKHVWEWHAYSFSAPLELLPGGRSSSSCPRRRALYDALAGFVLEEQEPSRPYSYTAPLLLSEFGFYMLGAGGGHYGLRDADWHYFSCLREYAVATDMDWGLWSLEGSYYVREGVVDHDEGFGVLDHDWVGVRNSNLSVLLAPMFNVTQGPP
ncbi:glycoside hydrolase superfamily [Xylariaceae sp. FL0804]|nr:glycoside hydrolase superfamily [Xylariaceae sp. FL0804]